MRHKMQNQLSSMVAVSQAIVAWSAICSVAPLSAQAVADEPLGPIKTAVEYVLDEEEWQERVTVLSGEALSVEVARQLAGPAGPVDCTALDRHQDAWFSCIFRNDRAAITVWDIDVRNSRSIVELRLWLRLDERTELTRRGIFYSHWRLELTQDDHGWEVSRVLRRASGG